MTLSCRAFFAIAALVFVAGCAGGSSSVTPATPTTRALPGSTAVTEPRGWPDAAKKKKKPILFIADFYNNVVRLYDPKTPNPPQEGSITDGVDDPVGLAVDSKGSLYVSNDGSPTTITVYSPGESKPRLTIPTPQYYGITVDSKGDIFATGSGAAAVYGYKPGAKKPYETIGGINSPVGLAVDGKNNVWMSDELANKVYVIAAGTKQAKDAGLVGLDGPIGISVGPKNVLYVANFGSLNVRVYPAGSKKASATITDGITSPTLNGVTAAGIFFQANLPGNVVGYKKGRQTPFSTISVSADGVASSPLVKK
jgi:hypothetical protein